jgi:hypothetical protein
MRPSYPKIITLIVGTFFCAALTVLPDLSAILSAPPDRVWSPVNSMNYRYNDLYYQVPWVRKIMTGELLPAQPSNVSAAGQSFETGRIVPFWISALPGLAFSDVRIVIVVGFVLTACLIFGLSFLIGHHLTGSVFVALLTGFSSYFLQTVWSYAPVEPERILSMIQSRDLLTWLHLRSLIEIRDIAQVNDNLRYVSIAASVPVLLAHYLLCLRVAHAGRLWSVGALAIVSIALAFSYPTHAAVGYLVAGTNAVYFLLTRQWVICARFAAALALAGGFLLLIGYPAIIKAARESHPLYFAIYGVGFSNLGDLLHTSAGPMEVACLLLLNKYTLAAAVALALSWHELALRRNVLILSAVSLLIVPIYVTDHQFYLRALFTQRGVDVLWAVLLPTVVFAASVRFAVRLPRALEIAGLCIVLGVISGVPLLAFVSYAGRIVHTNAIEPLTIPRAVWDAYQFVAARATPATEIIATDWDDVTLLPALAPINLYYGNNGLQARTTADMIGHFVAAQKFAGITRDRFVSLVRDSFSNQYKVVFLAYGPPATMKFPFLDREEYLSAHFSFDVLYWHYVREVDGIPYTLDGIKNINPTFLHFVMDIFDRTDANAMLCRSLTTGILIDSDDTTARSALEARGLPIAFQNDARTLFSFDRGKFCR